MPTALFAKARTAGLLALTLALPIAISAVAPAQAGTLLTERPTMGSGDHRNCDSRRDTKIYFQQYGLKHVEVSKTHDRYVYLVKGYAAPAKEVVELQSSRSSGTSDYIRYVILFDGCDHSKTKILQPAP